MDATDLADKIIISPQDSQALKDIMSRLEPGDTISGGSWKGTVDEAGEKCLCISIEEISIHRPNEEDIDVNTKKKDGEEDETEKLEGPPSASLEIYKDDNGVPAQEDQGRQGDNIPSATEPPR